MVISAVPNRLPPGGLTAHFSFRVPILCGESSTFNFSAESQLVTNLKDIDLIIYDEVLKCPSYCVCVDTVTHTMQDFMWSPNFFWGKLVWLSGDFRQNSFGCRGWARRTDSSCMCQNFSALQAIQNTANFGEYICYWKLLHNGSHADAQTLFLPYFFLALSGGGV